MSVIIEPKKNLGLHILISFVLFLTGMSFSAYYPVSQDSLEKIIKESNFETIKSPIDQEKYKQTYQNDPVKEIFDYNQAFMAKAKKNSFVIFIQYNVFTKKCDATLRNTSLPSKFLELFNQDKKPLSINLQSFEIDLKYCNSLYGYGKISN